MVSSAESDGARRRQRAQQVALFRYRVICPALEADLSSRARGRIVRALAEQAHEGPFGGQVTVSRDTLDRWIRRYRAGGFDALVPSQRQPGSRIDTQVLELAVALKRENPQRTAAQVQRILTGSTGWSPSQSTLLRLFARHDLTGPGSGQSGQAFGRFEAEAPNVRWVGDAMHGPKVGGRKTFLFAFIDDHSRLLVGYRFGFAEDTVRLAVALNRGLAARGVPAAIYVDNGGPYVDSWLLRACGKLGIRLIHATPHRPQGKGKIERMFRTVRESFTVEVTDTTADDLAEAGTTPAAALLELNTAFTAWVESVYHHQVHSQTQQSPLDRWHAGWDAAGHGPATASADALTEAFKWSVLRTVTKTATVSLHSNTYQVEPALVGRRVELVFNPFDLHRIEVRHRDRSFGLAVPHTVTRHTHPKARPETPDAPPPATGIDYLRLVTDAHHAQLADDDRIGYHALYPATPPQPDPDTGSGTGPVWTGEDPDGQLPGQLSITDAIADTLAHPDDDTTGSTGGTQGTGGTR